MSYSMFISSSKILFDRQIKPKKAVVDVVSLVNPLSPHDALKHNFTSLKTDLISLQLMVLEGKFP